MAADEISALPPAGVCTTVHAGVWPSTGSLVLKLSCTRRGPAVSVGVGSYSQAERRVTSATGGVATGADVGADVGASFGGVGVPLGGVGVPLGGVGATVG